MSEITLEKIDAIRERTNVCYSEAKEALEACNGNIVDALVYIENKEKAKKDSNKEKLYTTKDELFNWIKETISKGNVTRIKVKKENKVLADIPVNAGLAVGAITLLISPLVAAVSIAAAAFTKITIEITKNDGSVEVVNKIIKTTFKDAKSKVMDVKDDVMEKVNNVKEKMSKDNSDESVDEENIYQYTVKFEDLSEEDKQKNQ